MEAPSTMSAVEADHPLSSSSSSRRARPRWSRPPRQMWGKANEVGEVVGPLTLRDPDWGKADAAAEACNPPPKHRPCPDQKQGQSPEAQGSPRSPPLSPIEPIREEDVEKALSRESTFFSDMYDLVGHGSSDKDGFVKKLCFVFIVLLFGGTFIVLILRPMQAENPSSPAAIDASASSSATAANERAPAEPAPETLLVSVIIEGAAITSTSDALAMETAADRLIDMTQWTQALRHLMDDKQVQVSSFASSGLKDTVVRVRLSASSNSRLQHLILDGHPMLSKLAIRTVVFESTTIQVSTAAAGASSPNDKASLDVCPLGFSRDREVVDKCDQCAILYGFSGENCAVYNAEASAEAAVDGFAASARPCLPQPAEITLKCTRDPSTWLLSVVGLDASTKCVQRSDSKAVVRPTDLGRTRYAAFPKSSVAVSAPIVTLFADQDCQEDSFQSHIVCVDERPCRECTQTCLGDSVCLSSIVSDHDCECAPDRFGPLCQVCACEMGECDENADCECADNAVGLLCDECADGFFGEDCAHRCSESCLANGVCDDGREGDGACLSCSDGFWGEQCDAECECVGCERDDGACVCDEGSAGELCEITCENCDHGECRDGREGDGGCDCETGFTGRTCSACVEGRFGDDCSSECSRCSGHGRCLDGRSGSGQCVCDNDYYGRRCQHRCSTACTNVGGTCIDDQGTCYCGESLWDEFVCFWL